MGQVKTRVLEFLSPPFRCQPISKLLFQKEASNEIRQNRRILDSVLNFEIGWNVRLGTERDDLVELPNPRGLPWLQISSKPRWVAARLPPTGVESH